MRRTAPRSLSDTPSGGARFKAVFAPAITPIDEAAGLFFMELQTETYDAAGAPRLEFGAPGPDSNALTRVRIAKSAVNPTLRQVFIPELPYNTSVLLEAADGEEGLLIVSFTVPGDNKTGATITLAPDATLSEVSQGDHDGVLQIILPERQILQTTIELTRQETGYFKYRTLNTNVVFSGLTEAEIKDAQRRVETLVADPLAAILSQVAFEIKPLAQDDRALFSVECVCAPTTKKVWIATLQTLGLIATTVGGGFAIAGASSWMGQVGAAVATAGGLFRGAAGLVATFTETAEPGDAGAPA